jgi:cyanobactin maturation PatA/PatG family protease
MGLLGVIYSGGDTDNDSYICSQLDLARAILSAAEAGAHVINISGGQQSVSGEPSPLLAQAIQTCVERNILIVAAAGNNGCRCLHVPAAERSVLAVGTMDSSGYPLPFSNWGDLYQLNGILAPREKIFGAAPDGQTESKTGTSFATAIMTGVVGCLLSLQLRNGNEPDPHAVKAAILKTALPCPTAISDRRPFLVGRLNLFGVVNTVLEGGTTMTETSELANPAI